MGWWKCNKAGGIDWHFPRDPGQLINAIPGKDSSENYWNGDAPADAMYVPIAILKSWFINREPKPTKKQLINLFTEKVFDNIFRHIDKGKLFELVDMTWKRINAIYNEAWDRSAYPEEREYICLFSFGRADESRNNWWEISHLDKNYIKDYHEGKWPWSDE